MAVFVECTWFWGLYLGSTFRSHGVFSFSWMLCCTGSARRVVVPNLAASSLARADPPWQLSVGAWGLSASFSFRNLPNQNLAQGKWSNGWVWSQMLSPSSWEILGLCRLAKVGCCRCKKRKMHERDFGRGLVISACLLSSQFFEKLQ